MKSTTAVSSQALSSAAALALHPSLMRTCSGGRMCISPVWLGTSFLLFFHFLNPYIPLSQGQDILSYLNLTSLSTLLLTVNLRLWKLNISCKATKLKRAGFKSRSTWHKHFLVLNTVNSLTCFEVHSLMNMLVSISGSIRFPGRKVTVSECWSSSSISCS